MDETAVKIAQFANFSPIFKGGSLIALAILALLFAYYMKKKWKEPAGWGYWLFTGLAVFILIYGLYIILFRPNWWALPY